jgi:hypothetical protein
MEVGVIYEYSCPATGKDVRFTPAQWTQYGGGRPIGSVVVYRVAKLGD